MQVDPETAAALGFPKMRYVAIERERRWLCREIPWDRVRQSEAITDLYVLGTRLRLREAQPLAGGEPRRRLTRKSDVDSQTRLLSSIYLTQVEYECLAVLPGARLNKIRHRLEAACGVILAIDCFGGPLEGLLLAEAEFESDPAMQVFTMPDFALKEVTDDERYRGDFLVRDGLPG